MRLRGSQHQGIGRRSQHPVGTIQFKTGRSASDQSEIADDLLVHALEDEARPRVRAIRHLPEIGTHIETLRGKSGTRHHLRRQTLAAPEAAVLAGEAMVVLAGFGHPCTDTILVPAYFHYARLALVIGDAPVPGVGTHVHETAAAFLESIQRVPHFLRPVLVVGRGHEHPIGRDGLVALVIQVLVGDAVVRESALLQPIDDVCVGIHLPQR